MDVEALKVVARDYQVIDSLLGHIPEREREQTIPALISESTRRIAINPECGISGLAILCQSAINGTADGSGVALGCLFTAHPELAKFIAKVKMMDPDVDARKDTLRVLGEFNQYNIIEQFAKQEPNPDGQDYAKQLLSITSQDTPESSGNYNSLALGAFDQEQLVATFSAAIYEKSAEVRHEACKKISPHPILATMLYAALVVHPYPDTAYEAVKGLRKISPVTAFYACHGIREYPSPKVQKLVAEVLAEGLK